MPGALVCGRTADLLTEPPTTRRPLVPAPYTALALRHLLQDMLGEPADAHAAPAPTVFRATPQQPSLYTGGDAGPGTGRHVEQLVWLWRGPLDTTRFTTAWQSVFDCENRAAHGVASTRGFWARSAPPDGAASRPGRNSAGTTGMTGIGHARLADTARLAPWARHLGHRREQRAAGCLGDADLSGLRRDRAGPGPLLGDRAGVWRTA
ncbi:hypothetical protein ACIHCX_37645 [Streptomyces sp. NPDC052043]|uniref:hypothetical protein n=1 Tax=Streptomyces sp. NPDC052043 TaxID=3365684 RepID=UPI0037D1C611